MYDELIKRLRDDEAWKNCDFDFLYGWMHEAADAIEELQKRVPKVPHGRLIEEADAIKTVWMILNGLGYLKEENPQLEQTVREVFATAPAIEAEEHG